MMLLRIFGVDALSTHQKQTLPLSFHLLETNHPVQSKWSYQEGSFDVLDTETG